MRRLIAYITMAVSMLIAIGVAATPVLTKLNYGREFTNGREIVFKVEGTEENELTENAADEVADEIRARLDTFNIEDYSVKVQEGNIEDDKAQYVTASFAVDDNEFDYIAKYLCFSGEDFSISAKDETTLKKDVFDTENAKIVYEQDTIPVVVIPVTDTGKDDIENIISTLNPESESGTTSKPLSRLTLREEHDHDHDHDHEHEGEGEETEQPTPDMFLWANFSEEEGDSYEMAEKDPLVRDKIIMSFYSSNIWYEKSKEEKTEVAFVCATATEDNQLDLSGLKDDNVRATYLLNMLKASKYDYQITCPTRIVTQQGVDYHTNAIDVAASAESLVSVGSNINIAFNTTAIATLVAVVIVTLLLVVYYRASALAMVSTTLGTLFLTILSFRGMGVLFNLPAIIGLIALAGGILLGEIVYVNRFKEEVYKGRSLKKANQEASKKSNLITLDASIIMAFTGLMMYVLGGTALKPLGVVLFFGAVFALLMNLIVFKILMMFLTNSTNLQGKYSAFNIDGEKVPNLMSTEEKPEYEGAYEKVDFTKKRKLTGIIFAALAVAAVAVITVFGVIDGSPLNVKTATKDTTVIYTELRSGIIEDETEFKNNILVNVKTGEEATIDPASVEMKSIETYDAEEEISNESSYFIVKLNNNYSEEERESIYNTLNESLTEYGIASESILTLSVKNSKELVYTPNQGSVALATGISIVGCALYAAFRFRPSRGISLLVTTAGSTAIAYGIMVATRLGTTAVTSLAMPIVAVSMMLASLFYLSTEKAMRKENRGELSLDDKKAIMVKALGKSASPMLVFMLITVYIAINYFGFGLAQTAFLFASALIGEIVATLALLTLLGPVAGACDKVLSKVHMPKLKMFEHKEKVNTPRKRNSSEPEETVFIGIND